MTIGVTDKVSGGSGGGSGGDAGDITVDTSGFTGNLGVSDTDVQTAMGTIDGLTVGDGHTHDNKATLDDVEEAFTTALKSDYDDAVSDSHTHSNKTTLDDTEEAFTTSLKSDYDDAVSDSHDQNTDTGTTSTTFQLNSGSNGLKLKDDTGLVVRNAADDADVNITGSVLTSTVADGTAPLAVTSTTVVPNLNADKLDGNDASDFAAVSHTQDASSINVDSSGFSGNLGVGDTDVQTALGTIDSIVIPTGDGINEESLTEDKTMTDTDSTYQWIGGTVNKSIILPSSGFTIGKVFVFKGISGWRFIKQDTTNIDRLYTGQYKSYIFTSSGWESADVSSGQVLIGNQVQAGNSSGAVIIGGSNTAGGNYSTLVGVQVEDTSGNGSGLGYDVYCSNNGSGLGYRARGSGYSSSFGAYSSANASSSARYNNAFGGGNSSGTNTTKRDTRAAKTTDTSNRSNAFGSDAFVDADNAIAFGTSAKATKDKQIALGGVYSYATRYGEQKTSSDDANKYSRSTVTFYGSTADDTPIELFLDNSSERLTIVANSVVAFEALITARDNVSNDCAVYKLVGAIKRDDSDNTAIVGTVSSTTIAEDDADWDVAFTADDTNEALILTVTGDDANPTQFQAVVNLSETRF